MFYDTLVWANTVSLTHIHCFSYSYVQGLTQVEEMLIAAVMPIMSVYRLPRG